LAYAAEENGMKSIGIIRGEELASKIDQNPTLQFAQECDMQLEFVSREVYRNKENQEFLSELQNQYGDYYLVPEGGTNHLAIKGCEEILTGDDAIFDYVCCAVGTGGTISGIINSAKLHQKILGFPALKGDFLQDEIRNFVQNKNWELIPDYHFGGYGKITTELIGFINDFFEKTKVPLDPIYTGKMFFGVMNMIENNYFPPNSKILLIHTGGLQGVQGMNNKLRNKQLPIIKFHV
jgi:1-aminocyclopropane-1-carboxylate deaminase